MLTLFGKKRISEDRVANVFVNGIQALIDSGFDNVVGLINDSPEFIQPPGIKADDIGVFTMIVLSGNIQMIPAHFDSGQDKRITELILEKFATLYEIDKMELAVMVGDTRKFMSRKNHPSKNTLNGMAKGLFCRMELNGFQEPYFKSLQSPNPIFIQRLKDALENFMWDWASITEKYRIVQQN